MLDRTPSRTLPRTASGRPARPAALLAMLALALGVLLVPAPAVATAAQDYVSTAFTVTNKVRGTHDRKVLKPHACLRKAAARQARKMAGELEIFHQPLGPLLSGCDLELVGENVAYGYATGTAVVKQGWMKSAGHRANVLRKGYTHLGMAARRGEDGRWYVAQVFGTPSS